MNPSFRRTLSFGLNVVLAAALAVAVFRPRPEPPSVPAPKPIAERPVSTAAADAAYPLAAAPATQRRWLIDELRRLGVPNRVLGRVAQEDIDQRWNRHAAEVTKRTHGDLATMDALQLEIDLSMDADMRAALGDEGFRQWDQQNMLREANAGGVELSGPEVDAAYTLWKKLRARELEINAAKVRAEMDQADIGDALHVAALEFEAGMKAVLGAERFAQAQALDAPTAAAEMRQNLAGVTATEAQFGELLRTQQRWNEVRREIDELYRHERTSAEYASQVKALDAARDHEFRRVLGDAAFDALQKEQHPGYALMKRNAAVWGLDERTMDSVYGAMRYEEKVAEDYRTQARARASQGQAVDWDHIDRDLRQYSAQNQEALRRHLGPDRFEQLAANGVFRLRAPSGAPDLSARVTSP